MEIIDEEGRLFGAVNVVDALVVLVVLAVAVAGFALVAGGESAETETRYVTLDLGTQPAFVVDQLDVGDTAPLDDEFGNLTITDTYLTRSTAGTQATIRVAVTGRATESQFTFGGEPLRLGRSLPFENESYVVNGTVTAVGNATELTTRERTVVLRGTVPDDVARNADAGDEIRVGDESVATFRDVAVYNANNPDRRTLYVVASLQTIESGGEDRFGDRAVEVGESIPLSVAGYRYNGTIERVGSGFDRQTSEVMVTDVVDVDIADRLEEGTNYTVAGRTVATIEQLAVYGTDNPNRKRVYLGLSVRALGYGDTLRFGADRSLREGVTLPLRTASYEFSGEIVRIGTLSQPGEVTDRTVTLRMENVQPERADSVEEGLAETNAGQTIARVLDVQVEPAVITLTSEDGNIFEREHPVNKDVTLAVELRVREQASGVQFKGRILQEGDEVILDLGTTTVRASVAELNDG
jgi:hypothetical protein